MNVKLLKVNDTIKDKHLGVGVIIAVNTQYQYYTIKYKWTTGNYSFDTIHKMVYKKKKSKNLEDNQFLRNIMPYVPWLTIPGLGVGCMLIVKLSFNNSIWYFFSGLLVAFIIVAPLILFSIYHGIIRRQDEQKGFFVIDDFLDEEINGG